MLLLFLKNPLVQKFSSSLLVLTIPLASGCAARCYVTSEPSGAKISVNDRDKGKTPRRIWVGDQFGIGNIYIFKAELPGYKSATQVFKEPGLGDANDAIPGAVHFNLEPAP